MTIEEELKFYRDKYKDEARKNAFKILRYKKDGKNFKIKVPTIIKFNEYGLGLMDKSYFFNFVGYRKPLKGEFYLSGSEVRAYKAFQDMSTEFCIVLKEESYTH